MYRISRNPQEPIIDVDHVKAIEPVIRSSNPGRYHVNEISRDQLPSGHTSRRWGESETAGWDSSPRARSVGRAMG